uniref:Uncharacterized protein n=1 Tax=Arion vulgaris TaxID=1028688 RepID=A0A0B6YF10_9EUPU
MNVQSPLSDTVSKVSGSYSLIQITQQRFEHYYRLQSRSFCKPFIPEKKAQQDVCQQER